MSLINREALYEKACDLEAQALSHVGKIVNDETRTDEWRIWSAILAERTAFKHDIFDAPEAQPEQRWIPCSERLPKIGKEVLLSEPNDMFIAEYYGSGLPEGVWRVDGIDHYLQDIKGCAWMPLPEPWKEGEK